MGDFIKYRFPGGKIIEKSGSFSEIGLDEIKEGFFVTTFNGERAFYFTESVEKREESFSFNTKIPIVYSKEKYIQLANDFVQALRNSSVKKAVLSRVKEVEFEVSKITKFFHELECSYPNAFVYMISSVEFGTWIGASPELLLKSNKNNFSSIALAGTKKIDENSEWGSKEIIEQKLVAEFIHSELENLKVENLRMSETYEQVAGPIKHLKNDFSWVDNKSSLSKTLKTLHPTPAVSGFPQKEALKLIEEIEIHDRELYAGMIGVFNEDKTDIYVNLRCCQIQKDKLYLYLGGGFTKDSVVENEWEETENKSQTLLKVIQKM